MELQCFPLFEWGKNLINIVLDTGKILLLNVLAGVGVGDGISSAFVDLYTNDVTPSHTNVYSDFTLGSWTGYAQGTLTGWVPAVISADFHGTTTCTSVSFTNLSASPVTVYGYVCKGNTSGIGLMASRFDGAPVTIPAGGSLIVQITFTDTNDPPP